MLAHLKSLPRQSILTLIGTMLIKLSTSVITCWGNINLYLLSYFYYQDEKITANTNSFLVLANILPITFLMLFATKLCDRFGYETIVRICSFIFVGSPMILFISFNFYTVLIFGMLIPTAAFAISTIPVINCLWTRFKQMKNKATAAAVICFTIGSMFWNYILTLTVNPNNQPTIKISEDTDFSVFSQQVSNNVVSCVRIGYILCGSMFVIGAHLVSKDQNYQESVKSQEIFQLGNMKLQNSNPLQAQSLTTKKPMALSKALLDYRFVSIFFISLLTGVYQIFLMMNLKIIYMPIIQDDRFLVYCAIVSSAASIIGSFIWGYFGDKRSFYQILLIYTILDFGVKFFGKFATSKPTLMLLFIFIGLVDKAIVTVMGPGLVKIFGIDTATQLLPYKGLSVFFGFLLAPIGYIVVNSYLTPLNYLFIMVSYSFISVLLAIRLYRKQRLQ